MAFRSTALFHSFIFLHAVVSLSQAEPPRVHFDTTYTVQCQDVSTEEFLQTSPSERLIEARFQVSSLITKGEEDDLIQYFYRIESPHGALRIADFSPQTTLAAEHAGNITVEKQDSTESTIGATVPIPNKYSPKSGTSAGVTKSNGTKTKFDLLPPMELLAASGTIHRGTGVYFKLKPSDRTTLEGAKEFVVVMRVSDGWRADLMHIHCRANGFDRGVVRQLDEKRSSGGGDFIVALYLEGDDEARSAADQYAQAERRLRKAAVSHQADARARNPSSLVGQIGALFSPPAIPENWLSWIIFGSPGKQHHHFPEAVGDDVLEYQHAKMALLSLSDAGM